ncbi:MAG: hypothetical protein MJ211_13825 [Bacteroidales bacterium]|nr:hypothetical protein [Bacteroidales bacterium]
MKSICKVLVCASTKNELSKINGLDFNNINVGEIHHFNNYIDILITGVGYFSVVYYLTKTLFLHEYCVVFAVGICGDYNQNNDIPQIYVVKKANFADTGFENENKCFQPLVGSKFLDKNMFPFKNGSLINNNADLFADYFGLKIVTANSVNRTNTDVNYLTELLNVFPADIETMESAAFHYVCIQQNVNFVEIRASSNHTIPKCNEKWRINEAVLLINNFVEKHIFTESLSDFKNILNLIK